MKNESKLVHLLSIIVIFLAIGASAGGLFLRDLYRDNPFVTSVWQSTDLMTLTVATPLFIAALILSQRGSLRAQLIWLAMLDYFLYNYAYYVFAAAFNWFFLIYVSLFVASLGALIFGLANLNVQEIARRFRASTPVKWISGYMIFVAIGLSTVYLIMSLGFIVNGQIPQIIEKTGHITSVVFALDLSLVVPVFGLAAFWLWKRQPWGYVLAAISIVKGTVYTLVLAVVSYRAAVVGFPEASTEIPLWLTLAAGGVLAIILLLGNIKPSEKY